jgi:hypothetical protein
VQDEPSKTSRSFGLLGPLGAILVIMAIALIATRK